MTERQEVERRKARYVKAKQRVDEEEAERGVPGDVNQFFLPVDRAKTKNVLIVCRVSTPKQAKTGQLKDQERMLRKVAQECGMHVMGIYCHVGKADNPRWIIKAVKRAKRLKADMLLAESIDRYVRHPHAHKNRNNYDWQPRQIDLEQFAKLTKGLTLTTAINPNASHEEVLSHQRKRGQESKTKGGRPILKQPGYKVRIRRKYVQVAVDLHLQGFGSRRIANRITSMSGHDVSYGTVHNWIKDGAACVG